MNIIANNVASKLFVAFVAASMLFTLATPSAKAATVEELQAMIAQLTAQIAALSGGSAAPAAGACTFTRALTVGSEGSDVKCLQDYLTPTYFTNAGGSTGYFGPVTAAAVAAWQTANGVMPAAGYFGPVSQAKYNALMASAGPVTGGGSTGSDDEGDDMGGLSGEASLKDLTIDSASDDELDEGEEDAEIATATFEFEDGDAMITRIDVGIDGAGDVWDVLDEVSLWVDGDEVARTSASDKDDYQDEDTGTLRFSGLDLVAAEDEEVEVMIAATFQNNIDTLDQGTYNVSVDGFRWTDAEDVTETETTGNDLDTNVTFTLGEAGQDDELVVKTSTEDPESTTLAVEDDAKSDWYTVFAFDLDTDDSQNDITINELSLIVDTASSTGSASTVLYSEVVDDVELVIDGVTIDTLVTAGGTATGTAAGYDESRVLRFDVDGDVVIDAGDRVTAELKLRFKSLAVADEGVTVRGRVTAENRNAIDAEGANDVTGSQLQGAATGDAHTLRTMGAIGSPVSMTSARTDASITGGNDYVTHTIKVDLEAFNQDLYISKTAATSLAYEATNNAGTAIGATSTMSVDSFTSTADEDGTGAYFFVPEGSEETFTIVVKWAPAGPAAATGVLLSSVSYNDTADAPDATWDALPAKDYRTPALSTNN